VTFFWAATDHRPLNTEMAKAPAAGKKKTFKKKERKNIPYGIVHISASFNNTLISITDTQGNLVAQSSSGGRPREGTGRWPRICDPRNRAGGYSCELDSRHHADPAQRLSAPEAPQGLICWSFT